VNELLGYVFSPLTEAPRIQSQSAACLPQINSLNGSRLNPFTEPTASEGAILRGYNPCEAI
jgi:hypothetical protein